MNIQQSKNRIKEKIYPFVNKMVDAFYNDYSNSLIEQSIENDNDKSVFLMFVMMYFGIHLKLDNNNDNIKKDQIKILMTELIKDPAKRQFCIKMFETKFQDIFKTVTSTSSNDNITDVIQHERLFLKIKEDEIINTDELT